MQSYRKRIAVQMQPVKHKPAVKQNKTSVKKLYPEVRNYLLTAIRMHQEVLKRFKVFSDEWVICQNDLFKYRADFELLEKGTYEERKEVVDKYGR